MVPPDDPSARPDEKEHEHEHEAKAPASTPATPERDDDPPLSQLAAAATDRPRAKTLGDVAARLPPAPKIPPPPAIAAGTRGRVKTGLAFEFDLGDTAGPVSLSKFTAGPAVLARKPDEADEDAPTIAREEAGAADALAQEAHAATVLGVDATESADATERADGGTDALVSEPAIEASAERSGSTRTDAESSGRSGAPRLPVPGMLGKRAAPEFRDARRVSKAPMGPGIVPPGGVMPPGAVEAVREPQDTNLLIDVVAAELMEPPSEDELPVVAPAAAREASAGSSAGAASMHASGSEDPSPSRRWMIAAAAVLLLGVAVWGMSRDAEPGADDSAKAVAKANPGEAAMVAKTEPPRPADPPRERIALAQDDGAAKAGDAAAADGDDAAAAEDPAAEDPAAVDADDAGATGGEDPAEEDMVLDGADAEAAPAPQPAAEATPASTSSKASTSRRKGSSKSSSKSSSKTSSSTSSSADASSPATSSKPGGDDAKSLLAQAKSTLSAGNGSKAYSLASKSHKLKYSTEAIEVMTIASCMKKDEARAKSLFKQVPLFRRSTVKAKCKSSGIKVGI
jgi:hypothetical protein